jgi:pilus assembly protein CpaB
MNRQMRTFVVLVIAVVVAGAASFAVYRAVTNIPVRQVEIATAKAVVASKALPMGTMLTRDTVKLVDWPARTPLEGGFTSVDDVVDRGLLASVVENEPLTTTKVALKEAGAGLPPTIAEGMRAISIKVNEVIGVAGFVTPGTRVDVVVIIQQGNDKQSRISRVVVSNIPVLTAGTRYDQDEGRKDGKAVRSTVVTLMVSPDDAERIALAQADGELMLTLRNPLDVEPTKTNGIRMAGLFASPSAPATSSGTGARRPTTKPVVPPPPPIPATAFVVQTIKAGKSTEQKLD